ncbi:MAG: OB-fold nucleic acid binding domain-containing protein [Candidatus Aenigmatarchaeota archaeon]
MKEKTLMKISLVIVLFGLILMFIIEKNIKINETDIKDISEKKNYVIIRGEIIEVSKSNSGTIFLKIKDDTGVIDAIIFKNSIKNIENISVGKIVKIGGKPQNYKNKIEIIVNSLE